MTVRYVIEEDRAGTRGGPVLRGGALELWRCRGPEAMLSGPAQTGKTFAACFKLDSLLWAFRGAQAVICRKVRATMFGSVIQTYRRVLGPGSPVVAFGGEHPQFFDYPNGSRLWVVGMDDPGKALSSERDFAYVNQAEELTLDDWEVLTTRCTGRAGNAPYGQVFGDCNPGPPHHWIKGRPSLRLFESRHEDNPTLFDPEKGGWTELGRASIAALDRLSGVRKERLRHGRWVSAEGVVYEFDDRVHLLPKDFPIPASWPRYRAIDFGYTNPFACLWGATDPDGRLYVYRELYMTQRTVKVHAERVKRLSAGEIYSATVSDHDAEDRATLHECGIRTVNAVKDISPGIQAVQERLKLAGDGRPRLYLLREVLAERDESLAAANKPTCLRQEFDAYQWPPGVDGRPVKEVPLDRDQHALDALRYLCMHLDRPRRRLELWGSKRVY